MQRDTLISIQRRAAGAPNALNEPTGGFAEVGTTYAGLEWVRETEKLEGAQEQSARVVRFHMRANDLSLSITSDDRIVARGATYRITGALENSGRRRGEVIVTGMVRGDG